MGATMLRPIPSKPFLESLSPEVQGHIGGLTARGGTRMGTAVRHATRRLKEMLAAPNF